MIILKLVLALASTVIIGFESCGNLDHILLSVGSENHSVQNLLSSPLLSKNLKIRIYKTIILPGVLYGCETWSLTLREEHRLGVFENRKKF
jgi:hypothetical protein